VFAGVWFDAGLGRVCFVLLGMSWGRGGFQVGLLSLGHGGGAVTYLAGITQLPPDRERERERDAL
jgi:hypothetical protein